MFAMVTFIRLEVASRRLSQLEADERFREHLSFVENNTTSPSRTLSEGRYRYVNWQSAGLKKHYTA